MGKKLCAPRSTSPSLRDGPLESGGWGIFESVMSHHPGVLILLRGKKKHSRLGVEQFVYPGI